MAKKLLIITYYWPPSGGAGVQRWLKFSRYLKEKGWEPVILTVDPAYASYPAIDLTLSQDVKDELKVYRTPARNWFSYARRKQVGSVHGAGFAGGNSNSIAGILKRFIRGNIFIPDPRRGWNRFAYRQAVKIIERESVSTVITTSPPHSTQLIGLRLKKRFPGIKWIADLRDPWTDIYYYKKFLHTPLARYIDRRYERKVLEVCDRLITVGPSLAALFESRSKGVTSKTEVVYNGYDEADFTAKNATPSEHVQITYTGTISDQYPMEGIIMALGNLSARGSMPGLRLRFIGSVHEKWKTGLQETLPGKVEFIDYLPHAESIDHLLTSRLLLLVIPENSNNRVIITGKLFEYLRTGIPILCIGPPDGDAAGLILENNAGLVLDYNDVNGIESALTELSARAISRPVVERYSKESIAEHIIRLL